MSRETQNFIKMQPLGFGRSEFGVALTLNARSQLSVDTPIVTPDRQYPKPSLEDPMVISKLAHESMLDELTELRSRIAALEAVVTPNYGSDCREMSDEEAKSEIAGYFRAHDGVEIYPSDVAHALLLDYDQVSRLLDELDAEGKIAAAR